MSTALDQQHEAYRKLRPQIIAQHKSGWVLIAREKLIDVFREFGEAVLYADAHYPDEQVLIRNTSEEQGIVPFIISNR